MLKYHLICKSFDMWSRFWDWYVRNVTKSFYLNGSIILAQIPHMIWNADAFLFNGIIGVFQIHPVLDFVFYGIDLIEIPLIINTILQFFAVKKILKKWKYDK